MLKLGTPESGLSDEAAGKLNFLLMESDGESEFSNEGSVEEEKLAEIMQELYKEITIPSYNTTSQVTQTPPSSSSPSPIHLSSLTFFSACGLRNESCGASMSNSSSTVMAGVAFVGPSWKLPENGSSSPENDSWVMNMEMVSDDNNLVGEEEMEGGDENGQWLARFLGWGPLELED